MKKLLFIVALVLVSAAALVFPAASHSRFLVPVVNTVRIDGPISPAVAQYIGRAIKVAESNKAQALIVLLETPGGLEDSMRSIVQSFYASKVPIVVYVWPEGARAASAGAIITMAANIAAMSPSTAIGAAHPVNISGGEPDKTMAQKVENDSAAFARAVAVKRGRDVATAEQIVRRSISLTEQEALKRKVIDLIAKDQKDLLSKIDGRKVNTAAGAVKILSAVAVAQPIPPTFAEEFLGIISNPNLVYLLLIVAMYGIIFELSNPGLIFPGVIGGISGILALYSLAILPVNTVGLVLILFAVALLVIDVFTPTHGVLTAGGLIAFAIGSLILFQTPTSTMRVSIVLVAAMVVFTGVFFLFVVGSGLRAQRAKVVTGAEGMIGQTGEARTDIDPKGMVFAAGTLWTAVTEGEPIAKGETIRIVKIEKLLLTVRREP